MNLCKVMRALASRSAPKISVLRHDPSTHHTWSLSAISVTEVCLKISYVAKVNETQTLLGLKNGWCSKFLYDTVMHMQEKKRPALQGN